MALVRSLSHFYNYFDSVAMDDSRGFLQAALDDIHHQKIPALRNYYYNICKICRCIIEDMGITLVETGEDIRLLSFVIDMETVFEKYLLETLRQNVDTLGVDFRILDGNREGRRYLFSDTKKYVATPDVVVRRSGAFTLIIDAKYKERCSETDRYQIISHALSYGVEKAVLLMPLSETSQPGLRRVGRVGENGVELYEYYISLESEDLEKEEEMYVAEMKGLCLAA